MMGVQFYSLGVLLRGEYARRVRYVPQPGRYLNVAAWHLVRLEDEDNQ